MAVSCQGLDDMEKVTSWPGRRDRGEKALNELRIKLEEMGFGTAPTGQEKFIPNKVHADIRKVHGDPTVRALRFQPDLMAYRNDFKPTHFECMSNDEPDYSCYPLEREKYLENINRAMNKQRCALVYKQEWCNKFVACWVTDVRIDHDKTSDTDRWKAKGSKTPYYLIRRSTFVDLEKFVEDNKDKPQAPSQEKLF